MSQPLYKLQTLTTITLRSIKRHIMCTPLQISNPTLSVTTCNVHPYTFTYKLVHSRTFYIFQFLLKW